MKRLLFVFSIIASFGIVVTASTITYSETTANAAASINNKNLDNKESINNDFVKVETVSSNKVSFSKN
ncbi:MAG: hypothetical protein P8M12_00430 [Flavobacteriales bacterium]|jgi:hypothetical protein|nr:hypothetical protein [Flavobacteriales bacterium]